MIDSNMPAQKTLLALSMVEELSIKKKHTLIESVPDICQVELQGVRKQVFDILLDENATAFYRHLDNVDDYIDTLKARDIHYITYLDDEYPDSLLDIHDFPLVLFFKGSIDAICSKGIAVVGTRRPTRYGAKVAQEFSNEFAKAGLTIISGLARGIDSIAHKSAIEQNAPTVAVFASGLDVVYPAEHRGLVDNILTSGGAIVSEYPLGTKPLQYHFPERNRIVSGLSRAVFLPQAAAKSGSLITMRLAIEQGKDIFITPGNIYDEESMGCNSLLREMPHALAISPEDVLDCLHIAREVVVKQEVQLSIVESIIIEALRDDEKHFEELLELTSLSVSELTGVLFDMELEGLIVKTQGNYYSKA